MESQLFSGLLMNCCDVDETKLHRWLNNKQQVELKLKVDERNYTDEI